MWPLNLQEAAQFLRMSKSSLYQRKDIPRYRRPGSRALLFDRDELEVWIKTGRIEPQPEEGPTMGAQAHASNANCYPTGSSDVSANTTLDIQRMDVYHRNPRYR